MNYTISNRIRWIILALLLGILVGATEWFSLQAQVPGQPAAEVAATQAEAADTAPSGFLEIIFAGGFSTLLIIIVLLGLSLTAAYLVFEQLMTLRRNEIMPERLDEEVHALIKAGQFRQAHELCGQNRSFLSLIIRQGLVEVDGDWSDVEKAMEDATAEQSAQLFRRIEYLSVIGNIAPMVGLLGTVVGMIMAFQQVASTQGSAGAGELAEGIYQALVTTVGGLIVAIPSLGAFAVFRNRIDQLVAEAAYRAQRALTPIKRRSRVSGSATSGASTPVAPPLPPGSE